MMLNNIKQSAKILSCQCCKVKLGVMLFKIHKKGNAGIFIIKSFV